jgi:4-carboxymuconolactone decarboxylase
VKNPDVPQPYLALRTRYPKVLQALDVLGETLRQAGPLPAKESHLIQLAASVASRSEGAAHSHARRAIEAGATPEEIRHTVLLLVSTIGFPATVAGLAWVEDVLGKGQA